MFDVGIMYIRDGKFYLAIDESLIITVDDTGLKELHPIDSGSYINFRQATVKDLVAAWEISLNLLDEIIEAYMDPKSKRINREDLPIEPLTSDLSSYIDSI